MKIISGGQTGVDRIGLETAKCMGLETGGTAPKGFLTELGPDLTLKEFGLVEHRSSSYDPRTIQNVRDSEGTVLFGNTHSTGTANTIKYCIKYHKPYKENPTVDELLEFIRVNKIKVLNVAGNRASKLPKYSTTKIRWVLLCTFYHLKFPAN